MNVNVISIFEKHKLYCGRMISSYKNAPKDCQCVWNANVVLRSSGKVWYGDLNLTKEGARLKKIAKELREDLYVLREMDCRFDTANDPIEKLIAKAVWTTKKQ